MKQWRECATSRRGLLKSAAASAAGLLAAPYVRAACKSGVFNPILGEGEHTYEAIHDWLVPPAGLKWGDTHGLCQDKAGRIYVAHTVHPTSDSSDAVVVYDPEGRCITSWGAAFRNGAHGLDLREEDGDEYLYHCDINRRLVVKTSLGGEVLWEKSVPLESQKYESVNQWRPTNVAFAPNGDFYVGDGYGSSYIHQYNIKGEYLRTIGSPGNQAGQLSCPHGLWVDSRSATPRLLVADRGNRRLQYFSLDGQPQEIITQGIRQPCHFKTRGQLLLVPDLDSVIMILDAGNKVVAQLGDGFPSNLRGAPREQFIPGKFIHPHDAIWLANGDILVAEWVPIGRITLLRKV